MANVESAPHVPRPVRLGVIGCGWVAENMHLPALRAVRDYEVIALADADVSRLNAVGARWDVRRRYADMHSLLADQEIDAVAICLPPQLHVTAAVAALDAEKHVFVEKPLALSAADAARMVARASAAPQKTLVGFNMRHHRLIRAGRELVRRGTLGRIKFLTATFSGKARAQVPQWKRRRFDGGGVLFELATHHFDLWRFLFDSEIQTICGVSEVEDESLVLSGQLTNGVLVSGTYSECGVENNEIALHGEDAVCRIHCYRADGLEMVRKGESRGLKFRTRSTWRRLTQISKLVGLPRAGDVYGQSYVAQWRHFAACIRDQAAVECTVHDGAKATHTALMAIESVHCNTRIPALRPGNQSGAAT